MTTRRTVVTLDGPAGSGKTVCGHGAAVRLGAAFVSSGQCYRAVAYLAMRGGAAPSDAEAMARAAGGLRIEFVTTPASVRVLVGGEDLTTALKAPEVTAQTRHAAENARVRELIGGHLRRMAEERDIVAEGRDMGTVVFPHAPFKFFLRAGLARRADRRRRELAALGIDLPAERLEAEIAARDLRDATRELCPLKVPADAVVIDTDDLSVEDVVDRIVRIVRGDGE
ncbi:MAG TPA: (d)CMP kinase [Planctomycetota bacterium]|nr:(d)CMP kinase [Planctomycetota bacterium]OQC22396.1 MAG: Cytidylate kinase [Planctomycetes bacterium ADurb.Bin069]HNR98859.1 (d)CMP kinase [Planctomycetota bacterium]HNU26656.1 (d)CMP kinase [Planctomycetota bacterium]HOE29155.1 (d)CMP kinase [Planctomycetota bacterium]